MLVCHLLVCPSSVDVALSGCALPIVRSGYGLDVCCDAEPESELVEVLLVAQVEVVHVAGQSRAECERQLALQVVQLYTKS